MNGFNDHNFLPLFIDKYRELPCLWQVRHPHYNNKQKRQAALEKLLELVKPVVPTATIPYLKTKIGGLRSTYLRERKKVTDSQRSRAAADDVYVPRLWYYERLRFLSDHTEVRESLSTLPSTLPSTPAEASDVQPGPSSQEEVPPLHLPYKRARKTTPMQDSALRLIQEASASLRALPTPEEAFACMAATKLQGMQEGQRKLCEDLLYKVLSKGVSGELTPKTDVIELDHPPPPPAATTPPPEPTHGRKRGRKTRE
ncbi:hypothetical protein AB205_0051860 [Aquarana catesbeiana]|uniref:MADF domain-containing protein n=1 Tax=Aquarana catesbeiana TaxID=8400 RepID=A0A2G9NKI4_AQUCT|nr:hypothetical protein AB205_0051860 [Aquarana catesbeiana]